MSDPRTHLEAVVSSRLDEPGRAFLEASSQELARGVDSTRFASLVSLASRKAPRRPLAPTEEERARAHALLAGWDPERWSVLEALRVLLVLSMGDLAEASGAAALEDAFRYAGEGELVALYRSLAFLSRGERFVWRAGEGCRTNIRPVFEAIATDNPYPFAHFGELAWNQMVVKALFVGAPAWRIFGLDRRIGPELARMALDLCDERRSAGRPVQPELWMCLGREGGERARAALEHEMRHGERPGRRAAVLGLARAGLADRLHAHLEHERDPEVARTMREALEAPASQAAFGAIVSPRT